MRIADMAKEMTACFLGWRIPSQPDKHICSPIWNASEFCRLDGKLERSRGQVRAIERKAAT